MAKQPKQPSTPVGNAGAPPTGATAGAGGAAGPPPGPEWWQRFSAAVAKASEEARKKLESVLKTVQNLWKEIREKLTKEYEALTKSSEAVTKGTKALGEAAEQGRAKLAGLADDAMRTARGLFGLGAAAGVATGGGGGAGGGGSPGGGPPGGGGGGGGLVRMGFVAEAVGIAVGTLLLGALQKTANFLSSVFAPNVEGITGGLAKSDEAARKLAATQQRLAIAIEQGQQRALRPFREGIERLLQKLLDLNGGWVKATAETGQYISIVLQAIAVLAKLGVVILTVGGALGLLVGWFPKLGAALAGGIGGIAKLAAEAGLLKKAWDAMSLAVKGVGIALRFIAAPAALLGGLAAITVAVMRWRSGNKAASESIEEQIAEMKQGSTQLRILAQDYENMVDKMKLAGDTARAQRDIDQALSRGETVRAEILRGQLTLRQNEVALRERVQEIEKQMLDKEGVLTEKLRDQAVELAKQEEIREGQKRLGEVAAQQEAERLRVIERVIELRRIESEIVQTRLEQRGARVQTETDELQRQLDLARARGESAQKVLEIERKIAAQQVEGRAIQLAQMDEDIRRRENDIVNQERLLRERPAPLQSARTEQFERARLQEEKDRIQKELEREAGRGAFTEDFLDELVLKERERLELMHKEVLAQEGLITASGRQAATIEMINRQVAEYRKNLEATRLTGNELAHALEGVRTLEEQRAKFELELANLQERRKPGYLHETENMKKQLELNREQLALAKARREQALRADPGVEKAFERLVGAEQNRTAELRAQSALRTEAIALEERRAAVTREVTSTELEVLRNRQESELNRGASVREVLETQRQITAELTRQFELDRESTRRASAAAEERFRTEARIATEMRAPIAAAEAEERLAEATKERARILEEMARLEGPPRNEEERLRRERETAELRRQQVKNEEEIADLLIRSGPEYERQYRAAQLRADASAAELELAVKQEQALQRRNVLTERLNQLEADRKQLRMQELALEEQFRAARENLLRLEGRFDPRREFRRAQTELTIARGSEDLDERRARERAALERQQRLAQEAGDERLARIAARNLRRFSRDELSRGREARQGVDDQIGELRSRLEQGIQTPMQQIVELSGRVGSNLFSWKGYIGEVTQALREYRAELERTGETAERAPLEVSIRGGQGGETILLSSGGTTIPSPSSPAPFIPGVTNLAAGQIRQTTSPSGGRMWTNQ